MIAVIADDFSGAAEIAGMGLRYGLKCEVQTEVLTNRYPELLVIDTHTRSSSVSQARRIVQDVVRGLPEHVNWIYKKTDSVFRGHIGAELETLLDTLDSPSALLVPANPSMGRVIIDGTYTINGCPLQETLFSKDPDSAYTSSKVVELLHADSETTVLNFGPYDKDPIQGIVIGNADKSDDLREWAAQVQGKIIPAGGAEFFAAILEIEGYQIQNSETRDEFPHAEPILMVQGTGSYVGYNTDMKSENRSNTVNHLEFSFSDPEQLDASTLDQWIMQLVVSMKGNQITVLRFRTESRRTRKMNQTLVRFTGDIIYRLFQEVAVPHIIVEGGSTASTIVRRMAWTRWTPIQVFGPGTVRMREMKDRVTLTVKPGSYPWPDFIKQMIHSPSF